MDRPGVFKKDIAFKWSIFTYDSSGNLVDADSDPVVVSYRNGVATGDSITVSKRAATTGKYDVTYSPGDEVAGDVFRFEESVVIGGETKDRQPWYAAVYDGSLDLALIIAGQAALQTHGDSAWSTADIASAQTAILSGQAALQTHGDSNWSSNVAGSGDIAYPVRVLRTDNTPVDSCKVWFTTDEVGSNKVAGVLLTDVNGWTDSFMLSAGSYYMWRSKAGESIPNPVQVTVV